MSATTSVTTTAAESAQRRNIIRDSPILPPLITEILVLVLFWLFVPNFGSMRTVSSFMSAASISAVVVIGITILMIAGEFDLSVGAMMAMGGYVFAGIVMGGGSSIVAVVLALVVTALLGTVNGLITIYTRIPSFIVTLGTRSIYRGVVWLYSGGLMLQTTQRLPVYDFFNGRLDAINDLFTRANFRTSTLWVLALGLLLQFVLTRTQFGNHVFAVGGNPGAAVAQGININRTKILCFALTGALAGFGGILTFSQFSTVFVATGTGLELIAIAAAVVGGTRLMGGVGSVIGGLLGILLINVLRSGVILMGVPSDNFEAIVGATIVGAALLNSWIRTRS